MFTSITGAKLWILSEITVKSSSNSALKTSKHFLMSVISIMSEKPNEKNSKVFILGLKLICFPDFGHNKNFPWKSKALTFAKFLIPVIWNNFRNVLSKFTEKFESVNSRAPKCPHFSHFEHDKNFPCKNSFVTFSCLLNPNFMEKIREKDKYLNHFLNSWL